MTRRTPPAGGPMPMPFDFVTIGTERYTEAEARGRLVGADGEVMPEEVWRAGGGAAFYDHMEEHTTTAAGTSLSYVFLPFVPAPDPIALLFSGPPSGWGGTRPDGALLQAPWAIQPLDSPELEAPRTRYLQALQQFGLANIASDAAIREAYGAALIAAQAAEGEIAAKFSPSAELARIIRDHLAGPGEEVEAATTALLEAVRRIYRPNLKPFGAPAPRKRGRHVAEALPQPTFLEIRELGRAYADARSLRYWSPLAGETAMLHTSPGAAHTAKLAFTSDLAAWWGLTPTTGALQALLQRFGPDGYLAVHIVVQLTLQAERVEVRLDDLILLLGWDPRSEKQHREMRREIWLYLTTMASTAMIGARSNREKYRDHRTGKEIDTVIRSPLVVILGDEKVAQLSLDVSQPPLSVTLAAGIFTDAHRGNRQVLTDYGDLLRLAKVPAGKAAGAWARSIGCTLHQKWREALNKKTRGDRYDFTRRELLDHYRVRPYYDDLAVTQPKRVITYWRDALGLLEKQAVIGKLEEPALPDKRKGLVEAFLNQRVTIPPPAALLLAAAAIQERATAARRRRGRPRKAINTPR